jgi:integrase
VNLRAAQLDMLASEAGRLRSLVLLLGVGGLRWGEAIAVRRRLPAPPRRGAPQRGARAREVHRRQPQSNENRTVVAALVLTALAATATGKCREHLLWTAPHGGYLRPPGRESWLTGAVARCQAADETFPRVTAHALRHAAALLAISAAANPKVVQRMLGHASAATPLDVYADLFECDLDAVAESVSKMCRRWA